MPKTPLQGISLSQLADGYAGKAIDSALLEVVNDIDSRGDDGKPRKVLIELTLEPQGKGYVDIDVQVRTKMPAFRPPTTKAKIDNRVGGLVFNSDCRENPSQMTTNDIPLDGDGNEQP